MDSDLFSKASARAIAKDLPVVELLGVVAELGAAGQGGSALELYKLWIQHNADNPLVYAMYFNLGVALGEANDPEGAKAALGEAIKLNPDFFPPYINLGLLCSRLGANNEAVGHWYQALNRLGMVNSDSVSYKLTILKNVGRVFEESRFDANAEDALRQSLELDASQRDVVEHWVILRQKQCKWPVIEPWKHVTRQQLLNNISALSLSVYADDPLWQLGNAYRHCKQLVGEPKETYLDAHAKRRPLRGASDRLKIGYMSSDLREHAIGFLTAEIYELHDRSKVETFVYYCGIPSSDSIHTRVKQAADRWVDISKMPDEQAAKQIFEDQIDILVDLNGDTLGARAKVLAMRPAPIIVNWLGFPGTTGSAYHHYIIADDFIIPPSHEIFYSEKVVRLPCYQPNDRKRTVANKVVTRQDVGLPQDAMVYCCFNGTHKITSFTWSRWMEILRQVPGSVLWLLENVDNTIQQLRKLAAKHDVAPERLFFAPRWNTHEHLARYTLADLFLDTTPYGAHTTSSDAMWMGVPVLTLSGRSFASRVCGSLAKSAGLEELVCFDAAEYVTKGVALGNDRRRLQQIREKLVAGRDKCVLFDTPALVARLEDLYAGMWRDLVTGNLPRPDLSNLDLYLEIGTEIDRDDIELLSVRNYADIYRAELAARHKRYYIRPDNRLWPESQSEIVAARG